MRLGYAIVPVLVVMALASVIASQGYDNAGVPTGSQYYGTGTYNQLAAYVSNPTLTGTAGQPVSLTAYISGGSGQYYVQAKMGGASSQTLAAGYTSSFFDMQYTPTQPGQYVIEFYVTDKTTGIQTTATQEVQVSPLTVNTNAFPLSISASPTQTSTDAGQSVSLTLLPYGGQPGYTITPLVNGALYPAYTYPQNAGYSPYTFTFTPPNPGNYNLEFKLTDSVGETATTGATVSAVPNPFQEQSNPQITVSPSYANVNVGATQPITVTINGGVAPYTVNIYGGEGNLLASSPVTYSVAGLIGYSYTYYFTGYSTGTTPISVSVVDKNGNQASATVELNVVSSGASGVSSTTGTRGITAQITSQSNVVAPGTKAQVTATPSSNLCTPCYLSVYLNGQLQTTVQTLNNQPYTYTFTPVAAASYQVQFTIVDASGSDSTTYSTLITAQGSGAATGSTSSGSASGSGLQSTSTIPQIYNQLSISTSTRQGIINYVSPSESTSSTATVSGGSGQYSIYVYINGVQVQSAIGSTWTYSFTPSSAGSYTVQFKVVDSVTGQQQSAYVDFYASGTTSSTASTLTTTATTTISQGPLSLSTSTQQGIINYVSSGQSTSSTVTVSGGSGQYSIYVYLNGVQVQSALGSTWTYSFTTSSAGSYTVQFKVVDSVTGQQQSAYVDFYAS